MNRRQLLPTVGIVLGTMVAVCGLYLGQLPAGDQSTKNAAPDKHGSVTISQFQLQNSSTASRLSNRESSRSRKSGASVCCRLSQAEKCSLQSLCNRLGRTTDSDRCRQFPRVERASAGA